MTIPFWIIQRNNVRNRNKYSLTAKVLIFLLFLDNTKKHMKNFSKVTNLIAICTVDNNTFLPYFQTIMSYFEYS